MITLPFPPLPSFSPGPIFLSRPYPLITHLLLFSHFKEDSYMHILAAFN